MNELRPSSGPLTFGRLGAYAAPALPLAVVVFPSYAILPGFYAQHTAIPMATIGVILIVARAFDAIVDPLIGYLSDRTRSRRSEEHTSELQSLMRISYAVFCLKKKKNK